jgi:hypothetical protein
MEWSSSQSQLFFKAKLALRSQQRKPANLASQRKWHLVQLKGRRARSALLTG